MYNTTWGIFLFLILLLVPMIYLPRLLQREIQAIFLLLTRRLDLSMVLFSMLFLPGIVLHESSHYLVARLLGVRTGRFSILPRKMQAGQIRLGYVETSSTDFVRDALIGLAPLIVGGIVVALVGIYRLGLNALWTNLVQGHLDATLLALKSILIQPDVWLWFYFVFTISSTMMPSASDRRSWLPVILMVLGLLGIILIIGAGSWIMTNFGAAFSSALNAITLVFGMTILVHLFLLPPAWLLRILISRVVGLRVA